jgi:hypothetical protein
MPYLTPLYRTSHLYTVPYSSIPYLTPLYRTLLLYTVPYSLCCKQGNVAYIAVELYGQATERHNLSELAERIPVVHPGNINTYSYLKIIIY